MRDLNDFQGLINFFKSFYQKELEEVIQNSGKKVPVVKKDLVQMARIQKLDQFSSKCMLHSIHLLENMHENRQVNKPNNPSNIGPKEMSREYIKIESQKDNNEHQMRVIRDLCTFTAIQLSSEPDIRRGLKKHIYEYGVITT